MNEESVHSQSLAGFFKDFELVIFISRHSSESGTPTLSVHAPGNLGKAELGGLSRKVSFSPANAMRDALKVMARYKAEMRLDYEVSYEATHHGPCLDAPTMFAELGSSSKQWSDSRAAEIIGHAVMDAARSFGKHPVEAVLGVGGLHYNSKFTRMALENEVAFGHIIPKYAIPDLDIEILRHCVQRTLERVNRIILDWKGIKSENKVSLIRMFEEMGLPFDKV
jgi:D-aminoacyl-tRNA deacylase